MNSRISSHKVESESRDKIRTIIDKNEEPDALFRDITERDYGIDAIVELFDNNNPTGKIAFLQIKGTQEKIIPLKRTPEFISVSISNSSCYYANQYNIPVMLVYCNISNDKCFYFCRLQDYDNLRCVHTKNNITIRIPIKNNTLDNMSLFFEKINEYYNSRGDQPCQQQ